MTTYDEGWNLNSLKRLLQSKKDKEPQKKKLEAPFGKGLESLGSNIYFYNGRDEGVKVELDGWTQISETQKRLMREMEKYKYTPRKKDEADLLKKLSSMRMAPPFPTEWTVEYHPPEPKQKKPKVKKPKLGKWDVKLE